MPSRDAIRIDADAKAAVAELRKLADEFEKSDKTAQKPIKTSKAAAEEARRSIALQRRLVKDLETDEERYARTLAEARQALKGNANETELLRRLEVKLAKERVEGSEDYQAALARQREAERQQEEQKRRDLGIIERVRRETETSQERIRREYLETTRVLRRQGASQELIQRNRLKFAEDLKAANATLATETHRAFSPSLLAKGLASYVSIRQAVQVITQELRDQQELIDRRAQTQVTVAQSRDILARNTTTLSPEQQRLVEQTAARIVSQRSVSEALVNQALATAISASGGDVESALSATDTAFRFFRTGPENAIDFVGSLLDLQKASGSPESNTNLGLLSAVGELSRVVNPRSQARNIPSSIIGARAFGATTAEAAALFAALTNAAADFEGAISATGVVALARQIQAAGPASDGEGGLFPDDVRTLSQRIAFLQGDRGARETFLQDFSAEQKVLGPLVKLLSDPDSVASQLYAQNLQAFPDAGGLAARGQAALDRIEQNTLASAELLQRTVGVALERFQTRRDAQFLTSQSVDDVRLALQETGLFGTDARFRVAARRLDGRVSIEDAIRIAEGGIQVPSRAPATLTVGGTTVRAPYPDVPLTPEQQEANDLLRELVAGLQRLSGKEDMAQQERAKQTKAIKGITPPAPTIPVTAR